MPDGPGAPPQPRTAQHRRFVAAVARVYAPGLHGVGLELSLASLLGALTPPLALEAIAFLAKLAASEPAFKPLPPAIGAVGPCQRAEEKAAPVWAALYVLAASERLRAAEGNAEKLEHAEALERGYFAKHVAAEERRMRSAAGVDVAAVLNDDRPSGSALLGWRAVLDSRTTPECRWAHGRNFHADRMPVIGWPGAVHLFCRCSAGPMVPGAPLIPSA